MRKASLGMELIDQHYRVDCRRGGAKEASQKNLGWPTPSYVDSFRASSNYALGSSFRIVAAKEGCTGLKGLVGWTKWRFASAEMHFLANVAKSCQKSAANDSIQETIGDDDKCADLREFFVTRSCCYIR